MRRFIWIAACIALGASPAWGQAIGGYVPPTGSGTVTSVAVGAISGVTTPGAAVTGAGTLSQTLNSQSANNVFAAPNGSAGAPSFRALVPADIPALTTAAITALGTSGATIPLLTGLNTWSASQTLQQPLFVNTAALNGQINVAAPNGRAVTGYFQNSGDPTTNWFVLRDTYLGNRQSGFGSGLGYATSASGNGATTTYLYTGAAMTVGHSLVAAGWAPAGLNQTCVITASAANSVSCTSTFNGTSTTAGYFWDASAAGNGSGPRLDFQSANSAGTILDAAGLNCGLISATAGNEQTDCDFDGVRNGAPTIMAALDASRPAFVSGVDGLFGLGDAPWHGAGHYLNRFNWLDVTSGVCVNCNSGSFADPITTQQATGTVNGVYLATGAGYIRMIPNTSGAAYNNAVVANDTAIIYSGGGLTLAPAGVGSNSLRLDSAGNAQFGANERSMYNAIASVAAGTGAACTVASTCHNTAGRITVGTAPGTTVVISFNATYPFTDTPVCFAQDETSALTLRATAPATTSATFTASGTLTAGDKISYFCRDI